MNHPDILFCLGVALAVPAVGCARLDDCPALNQSDWGAEAKAVYARSGLVVATRPYLSVGNDCQAGVAVQMEQSDVCALSADDDACVVCLKSNCCASSIDWFRGAPGQALGECVEQSCAAACPRSSQ